MTNQQRSVSPSKQLRRIRKELRVPNTTPEKLANPIHPSQPFGMRTIRLVPQYDDTTAGTRQEV